MVAKAANLCVVGSHDHDVFRGKRTAGSVLAGVLSLEQVLHKLSDFLGLLGGVASVALVLNRDVSKARACEPAGRIDALIGTVREGLEPVLVDRLGDEPAH